MRPGPTELGRSSDYIRGMERKNLPGAGLVGLVGGILVGIAAGSQGAGFLACIAIGALALRIMDDNDK